MRITSYKFLNFTFQLRPIQAIYPRQYIQCADIKNGFAIQIFSNTIMHYATALMKLNYTHNTLRLSKYIRITTQSTLFCQLSRTQKFSFFIFSNLFYLAKTVFLFFFFLPLRTNFLITHIILNRCRELKAYSKGEGWVYKMMY